MPSAIIHAVAALNAGPAVEIRSSASRPTGRPSAASTSRASADELLTAGVGWITTQPAAGSCASSSAAVTAASSSASTRTVTAGPAPAPVSSAAAPAEPAEHPLQHLLVGYLLSEAVQRG